MNFRTSVMVKHASKSLIPYLFYLGRNRRRRTRNEPRSIGASSRAASDCSQPAFAIATTDRRERVNQEPFTRQTCEKIEIIYFYLAKLLTLQYAYLLKQNLWIH